LKDELGNPCAAAKLLDEIGNKNISVGDATAYHKHANIIINKGRATAQNAVDFERILKSKVKDKFNIVLEREVIYMK
jgi:UDP-N-acetylenolpyruvoylglucosamine reductase